MSTDPVLAPDVPFTVTVAGPSANPEGTTQLIWLGETEMRGASSVAPDLSRNVTPTPANRVGSDADAAKPVVVEKTVPGYGEMVTMDCCATAPSSKLAELTVRCFTA